MTVADLLTPNGGTLTLHRAAEGLAGFAGVFDHLVAGDTLQISGAVVHGSGHDSLVQGVTVAWGGAGTTVSISFDTVTDRIESITLGRAVPLPGWTRGLALGLEDGRDLVVAVRYGDAPHQMRFERALGATAVLGPVRATFRATQLEGKRFRIDLICDPDAGPGMADLLHLIGRDAHADGDLQWLPDHLRDVSLVSVASASLLFDRATGMLPQRASVRLRFGAGHAWPIMPGLTWPEIGDLWAQLEVQHPLEPDLRHASIEIGGAILFDDLPQNRVEVTADWPGKRIYGRLAPGGVIGLGAALTRMGLPVPPMPDGHAPLTMEDLQFSAMPSGATKSFAASATIAAVWSIPLGSGQSLDLREVRLEASWVSGAGFSGLLMAELRLPGQVDIGLLAEVEAGDWVFRGTLERESGADLPLGTWVADLAHWLGCSFDLPDTLAQATITTLSLEVAPSRHDLIFELGCAAPLGGATALQIDLTLHCSKAADAAWTIRLEGRLVAGGLRFDLMAEKGAAPYLLAVADSEEPVPVQFGALLAALGGPAGVDFAIDLQAAAVALWGGASPARVFAADIGAGVDLTALPLVGPMVGAAGGLSLAFQLTLASRKLAATDQAVIDQINARLPARASPLPAADQIGSGLGLSTTVLAAGRKTALSLPVKADDSMGIPVADPVKPAEPLKWLDIDRHFGPAHVKRLGYGYAGGEVQVALDAALAMGPVSFAMTGLGVTTPLWPLQPQVHLDGMALSFRAGPVEIAGAFLRHSDAQGDSYAGAALIRTAQVTLSAIGEYAERQGRKSLFLYALLQTPIGGPPFFFVTGLAAGFGYNRRIVMPPVEGVEQFPLVARAMAAPGDTGDMMAELAAIRGALPVAFDQYFLAVGLKFTTFKLVNSFALLAVQFGQQVEIDVLGLATAILPPPEAGGATTPLAMIKVALRAVFVPEAGILQLDAQLTKDSYVLSRACHLTGGFSFYAWFKGPTAGDFVVSLGGYHPAFAPPDGYPTPPRVGLNWQVTPQLQIKGDLYCALTPVAMMAGGHLEATFHDGGLRAWFKAGLDLLIAWKPYHYDIEVYVDVGGSYTFDLLGTHTVTIDVGADLHIWGPEFSGTATVHLYVCSLDISFGASGPALPQTISWADFDRAFLHGPDKTTSITIARGLITQSKDDHGPIAIVAPDSLRLTTDSGVPVKSIKIGASVTDVASLTVQTPKGRAQPDTDFGVAPVGWGPAAFHAVHEVRVVRLMTDNSDGSDVTAAYFTTEPLAKQIPAALWGQYLLPDVRQLDDRFAGLAVTGLQVGTLSAHRPGQSMKVARDKLAATLDPRPARLSLPPATRTARDAGLLAQVAASLGDAEVTERRQRLLAGLGLDPFEQIRPGLGDSLCAAPVIQRRASRVSP